MRVALLNQTYLPDQAATAVQLAGLARQLTLLGHDVTVFCARRAYGHPEVVHSPKEVMNGVRVVRLASTGFGRRSFFHRLVDGVTFQWCLLWRLLLGPKHDLVIAFTSPPLIGFVAWLVCAIRGGRCVQWMMDINPDIAFEVGYLRSWGPVGRGLTALLRFSIRRSDHIVVLDRWMRARLLEHGARSEQLVVVPPWFTSNTPQARAEDARTFKEAHGIKAPFVVLFSGNHSIAHPLDTLLEAARLLRDDTGVQFLFVGGGLRCAEVAQFRQKHRLENITQLPHQPVEALPGLLSAGDLHVIPMGQGMSGLLHPSKIYGVLATGKPYLFIGPRESHVCDILDRCPYGYHVENGSPQRVVETIGQVRALTAEALEKVANENTRFAKQYCSVEASLSDFCRVVLAAPPAHPAASTAPSLRA